MRVVFLKLNEEITAHYDDEKELNKEAIVVAEIPPDVFDDRPLQVYEKAFELGREYQRKRNHEIDEECRKIDQRISEKVRKSFGG